MIVIFLFKVLIAFFNGLTSFFPTVSLLPFGIDVILLSGVGYVRFIATVFPPLGSLLTAFLIYLGVIVTLKVVAMIPIIKGLLYKTV